MMKLKHVAGLLGGAMIALASSTALAGGTAAGTVIENIATATYDLPGGATGITRSANVELTVQELINVDVTSLNSEEVETSSGATDQVLTFRVTNTGNAVENFELAAANVTGSDNFDMSNVRIYQSASTGTTTPTFNSSTDTEIDTSSYVQLNRDGFAYIFIVADAPASGLNADDLSQLTLTAISGSIPSGTTPSAGLLLANAGSSGAVDAVLGNSYTDNANGAFIVGDGSGTANVTITKEVIEVTNDFGNDAEIPGAIVTYQINVTVNNGEVDSLVISDAIPASMTYEAQSMTLGSTALTDTNTDADNAYFDANTGSKGTAFIDLGDDIAAGTTFTITLKAEID